MAWGDLSFEQREHLLTQFHAGNKALLRQVAIEQEMAPKTLVRRLQEHRLYKQKYAAAQVQYPTLNTRSYDDVETITSDNVLIVSDFEEPYADPLLKHLSLLIAIKYNLKTEIINGDFIASDQPGISSHTPMRAEDKETTYGTAIRFGGRTIDASLAWFDEIIADTGNHDDMVNRITGGQIDLGLMLEGQVRLPGYRSTPYAYVLVETSQGPYLVCHPRQYRNNGTALAQAIYSVYSTPDGRKAHIVIGHTHHTGSVKSPDNLRGCHSLGCMRDPLKAQYKNLNITTHYAWNQGFGMILNGHFVNFDLQLTDWKFWLGDLCPEELR